MERADLFKLKTDLGVQLKVVENRAALLKRKMSAVDVLLEEDEEVEPEDHADRTAEPVAAPVNHQPANHQPVAFFDVVRQVKKLRG